MSETQTEGHGQRDTDTDWRTRTNVETHNVRLAGDSPAIGFIKDGGVGWGGVGDSLGLLGCCWRRTTTRIRVSGGDFEGWWSALWTTRSKACGGVVIRFGFCCCACSLAFILSCYFYFILFLFFPLSCFVFSAALLRAAAAAFLVAG